jgi:hypothetical protein
MSLLVDVLSSLLWSAAVAAVFYVAMGIREEREAERREALRASRGETEPHLLARSERNPKGFVAAFAGVLTFALAFAASTA